MLLGQFLQYISRRRITGLGLLSVRKMEILKQDLSQLLWRIDIKLLSCLPVYVCFKLSNAPGQLLPVFLQFIRPDKDTFLLHMVQDEYQRHLDRIKEFLHPFFSKSLPDLILRLKGGLCLKAGEPDKRVHRAARILRP